MNRILEVFGKRRVLLPVIHCCDHRQARTAFDLAMEHADGAFFINQGGMPAAEVLMLASAAACHLAGEQRLDGSDASWNKYVGVNVLGYTPTETLDNAIRRKIGMVWADDASDAEDMAWCAETRAKVHPPWPGLLFGGVAFKGQAFVPAPEWGTVAARAARAGVDVVTTSGFATGKAPEVVKLEVMREALGDHALAIASGITPANVRDFLPHTNAFLVASGIEARFGAFDPVRLAELAAAIHGDA